MGATHLVFRLDTEPLRLLEGAGLERETILGPAVVGGLRSAAYVKDVSRVVPSIGAVLAPGAALALFGVPASELAGVHTPLEALWGRDTDRIADALATLRDPQQRLARFERELAARLPRVRAIHPGVAQALAPRRPLPARSCALAARAGLGPRRFAQLFREAVGVSPKRWLRLRRFQRVVSRASDADVDWALLAPELGYSDQPHLVRDFREFAGVTPGEYQRIAPAAPNHLPYPRPDPFSSRRG